MRASPRWSRRSRARRDDVVNGGAPAAPVAVEHHYLQFDGVGDYAVADAVFGGISGDYTIGIKVERPVFTGSGSTGYRYLTTGGPSAVASSEAAYDRIQRSGTQKSLFYGLVKDSTSFNYPFAISAELPTAPAVLATKRTATAAKNRVLTSDGVAFTADAAATLYLPDHLSVAASLFDSLVPESSYAELRMVSVILAAAEVPDSELAAWLEYGTADGVVTGIDHYWVASDIDGATIPARVGTVALALTGPTSSDLVAWSPS